MIKDYIRVIAQGPEDPVTGERDWWIEGDGEGDFREYASQATTEVVLQYFEYLSKQRGLAIEYLKEKGPFTGPVTLGGIEIITDEERECFNCPKKTIYHASIDQNRGTKMLMPTCSPYCFLQATKNFVSLSFS
jgi:hypothetical protein